MTSRLYYFFLFNIDFVLRSPLISTRNWRIIPCLFACLLRLRSLCGNFALFETFLHNADEILFEYFAGEANASCVVQFTLQLNILQWEHTGSKRIDFTFSVKINSKSIF